MVSPPLQDGQAELPTPNSTLSYWLLDPSRKLLGHRTTEGLPSTADVVIIGSGITGTFAARQLVEGGRGVVMLDAREACWGATGRNGGHCQPGIWDSVPEVARFELATFNLIKDLVAEHQIPCDWQVVGGVHAIFSQEVLGAARKQLERLRRHPDLGHEAVLIQDRAELAARHVPEALAAVYQPNAAKCWPYKLVAWLLERLIGENDAAAFNLQTNTPVEHLERRGSRWSVHTRRGRMLAQDVMLATNGYTSRLLPKMTELILPVRGQVCALETPRGGTQLPHSYVWMKGADHQYLIHRGPEDSQPDNGGEALDSCLILGGERLAVPDGEEGISRDDELNPVLSRALRAGLEHVVKLLPGNEPEIKALPAAYEWTGIMGYSRDCSPWVGRVPATLMGVSIDKFTAKGYL
ncbi:FAD dependent oxidoreductase [Ophiocordyceps sinensis CO18]|uniref:FAD dependent oxidoreductase n=1 Tax=Ophiocordyceps sinensis (strain Co18 / CGMCC 3.14243) TaxID=911162 RepID=T5AM97_OPHSC|nr:FAD dependent oxidoreductase [Ophiocordyceps sinensis CO18]